MSCREDSLNLRRPADLKKLVDSHSWMLVHYDQFGENGVVVRYNCSNCEKEWTALLLHKKDLR